MPTPRFVQLNLNTDYFKTTKVVTTGYFSGGVGTLKGHQFTTKSLSSTQKNYYLNMQYSSEDQFSVLYAHKGGSGSSQNFNTNKVYPETQALYKHYASLLLPPDEVSKGFHIMTGSAIDQDVYILVAERARMKDRINVGKWTLGLSGSNTVHRGTEIGITLPSSSKRMAFASSSILSLTDDSVSGGDIGSVVGARYNIVSGSAGVTSGSVSPGHKVYGHLYADMGIMVLSAKQLSSSIPGGGGGIETGSSFPISASTKGGSGGALTGLAPDLRTNSAADNAGKFAKAIQLGEAFTMRSEEEQITNSYFCRALAGDFNHSNNPTFLSGSQGWYAIPEFESDPNTFITTIGLFDGGDGELLATGRLSTPIQKNYETEATIKVNLTY